MEKKKKKKIHALLVISVPYLSSSAKEVSARGGESLHLQTTVLVGDYPGDGAFALFLRSSPGAFGQFMCLHPGEFALKKMLMSRVAGGWGRHIKIKICIKNKERVFRMRFSLESQSYFVFCESVGLEFWRTRRKSRDHYFPAIFHVCRLPFATRLAKSERAISRS